MGARRHPSLGLDSRASPTLAEEVPLDLLRLQGGAHHLHCQGHFQFSSCSCSGQEIPSPQGSSLLSIVLTSDFSSPIPRGFLFSLASQLQALTTEKTWHLLCPFSTPDTCWFCGNSSTQLPGMIHRSAESPENFFKAI